MPFRVSVKPEVARLASNDTGTRNVRVGKGTKAEKMLTFNRKPIMLDELPDEVKNDPYLVVVDEGGKKMAAKAPARIEEPDFVEVGKEDAGVAEEPPAPAPAPTVKRGRPRKATAKK